MQTTRVRSPTITTFRVVADQQHAAAAPVAIPADQGVEFRSGRHSPGSASARRAPADPGSRSRARVQKHALALPRRTAHGPNGRSARRAHRLRQARARRPAAADPAGQPQQAEHVHRRTGRSTASAAHSRSNQAWPAPGHPGRRPDQAHHRAGPWWSLPRRSADQRDDLPGARRQGRVVEQTGRPPSLPRHAPGRQGEAVGRRRRRQSSGMAAGPKKRVILFRDTHGHGGASGGAPAV